jgi:threonine aldolase
MCNVVAILTHCRAGEEVIAHETSHILTSEGAAHAAFTGVQILQLKGARGLFTAEDVRAAIRPRSLRAAAAARGGADRQRRRRHGPPLAQLNAAAVARGEGWATHMDGARLMNACASGIAAKEMAASSIGVDRFHQGSARRSVPFSPAARPSSTMPALETAPRRVHAPGRHLCRVPLRPTTMLTAWPRPQR